jgi:hypothetical protein
LECACLDTREGRPEIGGANTGRELFLVRSLKGRIAGVQKLVFEGVRWRYVMPNQGVERVRVSCLAACWTMRASAWTSISGKRSLVTVAVMDPVMVPLMK